MLARNVLAFGRLLRRAGLSVHGGRLLDAARALDLVGVRRRGDVRDALRALLVHRHEDLALFDRAFDLFWRRRGQAWGRGDLRSLGEGRARVELRFAVPGLGDEQADAAASESDDPPSVVTRRTWSAREAFRHKNFAAYTADEVREAAAILESLAWDPGRRRTRRWRAGRGEALDLRHALRRSLGAGGEILRLPRRERRTRPRPIVVLADISGSMERYTRMLLHFAHALVRHRRRVEAFLFATRLTRITPALAREHPDAAVRAVGRAVHDWGSGTRIGDALRAFNVAWARRVLRGGAVVLIVSDGWDRGDPARLAREMARLQRSCQRIVWLNPLLGTEGYEPLTRGMMAARPYVDDFLPAHDLASLESLAAHLASLPGGVRSRPGSSRGLTPPSPRGHTDAERNPATRLC